MAVQVQGEGIFRHFGYCLAGSFERLNLIYCMRLFQGANEETVSWPKALHHLL
jgi:hypothetical protein